MTPHVRLSLVLGAVVSVTGCVNESIFRRHLYFPWPSTMIRQRRMRNLRVVCSPRSRPHSRQGELRGDHVSTVWRSRIRAAAGETRYSVALTRQRYFFTAENAENAENGELLWALLSSQPVVSVPFPCFLPFSAFSAASAVKSRVVVLTRPARDETPS